MSSTAVLLISGGLVLAASLMIFFIKQRKAEDWLPSAPTTPFTSAMSQAAKLRQEFSAGRIDESQFKSKLRDLMVQDEQGNWWMIGYETGKWYRHDGNDWVAATPPMIMAGSERHASRRNWFSFIGTVIAFAVVGWGMGYLIVEIGRSYLSTDLVNVLGLLVWGAMVFLGFVFGSQKSKKRTAGRKNELF